MHEEEVDIDSWMDRFIPKHGLTLVLAGLIRFVSRHATRYPEEKYLQELRDNLVSAYQSYCKRYD